MSLELSFVGSGFTFEFFLYKICNFEIYELFLSTSIFGNELSKGRFYPILRTYVLEIFQISQKF